MYSSREEKDNIITASGVCLSQFLTEELLDGREEELYFFLVENAWETYEHYDADWIWDRIVEIAHLLKVS